MHYFWAFLVGGALCVIGQLLIDLTNLTPARILVLFVVSGVALSALGWYRPLAEFAGAGATVPLLGFGHLLAQGGRRRGGAPRPARRADRRLLGGGGRHRGEPCLRGDRLARGPQQGPELRRPARDRLAVGACAAGPHAPL